MKTNTNTYTICTCNMLSLNQAISSQYSSSISFKKFCSSSSSSYEQSGSNSLSWSSALNSPAGGGASVFWHPEASVHATLFVLQVHRPVVQSPVTIDQIDQALRSNVVRWTYWHLHFIFHLPSIFQRINCVCCTFVYWFPDGKWVTGALQML